MSLAGDSEVERVREVYARRTAAGLDSRYSYWTPANLYVYQSRERAFLGLIRQLLPLDGRAVLDAGCGDGGVLVDCLRYGARPEDLHGVDLLPDRIEAARRRLPGAHLEVGDARSLAYPDASFDLTLAFTLLSSVLGEEERRRICAELLRVTRPGGLIVVYDFWTNPLNRDARPVRRGHVRQLFPGKPCTLRAVTLAPPLVRLFAPLPGGWLACTALEVLPFVKTHFLAAVSL